MAVIDELTCQASSANERAGVMHISASNLMVLVEFKVFDKLETCCLSLTSFKFNLLNCYTKVMFADCR